MRRPALALLLSCAALAAGCGGSEEEATPASSTPAPTEEPATSTPAPTEEPAAQAPDGAVEVAMVNFEYVPENVVVEPGQTITWVNEDTVQHNAVAREQPGPDSELFNQGETYSWTADVEPGAIPYVCTIHPGMDGTITVR